MPIYEYQCKVCGGHCEILQKISDPPATQCPHCHAHELRKLVSAAGFQLKGTGWYVTDFRDKGKTKAKEKTHDKPEKSEKSEKKAEAKKTPEKKTNKDS